MKYILLLILAIIASATAFVIHVATVEWLPGWISEQMQGTEVKASWAVRYVAGITSIEYGIATIVLYYLARDKLMKFGKLKAAVFLSILLLALSAMLIRQPLMDYLVGNPFHVAIVQNVFKWLSLILMSFITVYGYEFIFRREKTK
ncbi:MAG: hypothetical protein L3J83_03515 [Proteobacteria bacterium]|nr:hypothetical protein [Pseudomonadota bacterium]